MQIVIVGAGSIGLLLAGRLGTLQGLSVKLITRTMSQAELICSEGVTLEEAGHTKQVKIQAVDSGRRISESSAAARWVLLTVKQKDLDRELLGYLQRLYQPGAGLLCFQNGLGHIEKLQEVWPKAAIGAAITTEGARRLGPSHVVHTGIGITQVGIWEPMTNNVITDSLMELIARLNHAGFRAEMSKNIESDTWNKLIINTVINPLTGILRVSNGRLLESDISLELMRSLFEEGTALAQALSIPVAEDLWDRVLKVCRSTAENRSSMLQDLDIGRRTELDWLNGSLLAKASEVNIPLPTNLRIFQLVRAMEQLKG